MKTDKLFYLLDRYCGGDYQFFVRINASGAEIATPDLDLAQKFTEQEAADFIEGHSTRDPERYQMLAKLRVDVVAIRCAQYKALIVAGITDERGMALAEASKAS